MFGGGASLVYSPSLVILGHYFKKRMGIVNGFVAAGSSIFTIVMPHILQALLKSVGLQNTFFFLAGLMILLIISALSFKPLMPNMMETENDQKGCCGVVRKIVYVDNWKNKKYFIWSMAFPVGLIGYFVFYVHIVSIFTYILCVQYQVLPNLCYFRFNLSKTSCQNMMALI